MTRLSADILEFAGLLFGDRGADVTITVDGRASLLPMLRDFAGRACKMELDLACLEAIAAEIDPHALTQAAGDATIAESAEEVARREALDDSPNRNLAPVGLREKAVDLKVIPFPVIARPIKCAAPTGGVQNDNGGAA